MSNRLLSCLASVAVLVAQHSGSVALDRPEVTATLEKTTATIEPGPVPTAVEAEAPPPAPPRDPPAPRGNPLWAIPLRMLTATRDRPLFSASRRPPPPVVPRAADPAPRPLPVVNRAPEAEQPTVLLVGTIIGSDMRIAIVLDQTTKLVTRAREGEQVSGWRIMSVSPHSAVMERDDRTITLDLPAPGKESPATGTVSQAPAPLNRRSIR